MKNLILITLFALSLTSCSEEEVLTNEVLIQGYWRVDHYIGGDVSNSSYWYLNGTYLESVVIDSRPQTNGSSITRYRLLNDKALEIQDRNLEWQSQGNMFWHDKLDKWRVDTAPNAYLVMVRSDKEMFEEWKKP